ncbi:MAG: Gfo/Idh/MocA family oxidoreductase [Anaerolineae bacterium]|nr:Gfo/Idh/MocA family oxidoreductase [Anaerolineae bacterium]
MNICIVGYGTTASDHALTLQQIGGCHLYSVVGRVPERTKAFAEQWGFTHWTTDIEEALHQPVDAVILATPSALHYEQARACLQAGKHLLVEIPITLNHAEACQLVELAARVGVALMVAHTTRFLSAFRRAAEIIRAGHIGQVYQVLGRRFLLRRTDFDWLGRERSWTDNLLFHFGAHLLDYTLWALDTEMEQITAQAVPFPPNRGSPMDVALLGHTRSGALASYALSFNSHERLYDWVIIGHDGTLRLWEFVHLTLHGEQVEHSGPMDVRKAILQAMREQDAEFLAALREGRPPSPSGADVLPTMKLLQMAADQVKP